MITAELIRTHYEQRLNAERTLLRYDFDNHRGGAIFPLPSHRLAFAILGILADRAGDSTQPASIATRSQAAQHVMSLIVPVKPTPYAMNGTARTGGYCAEAEPMFVGALRQLDTGRVREGDDYTNHGRLSVYHATDGTPIALRKQRVDSSALLLEPVRVNDVVTMPAGTIVDMVGTTEITGQAQTHDDTLLTTHQITDQTQLAPLRISPWAHEAPLDRALFGITETPFHTYVDLERARLVAGVALQDFQTAARSIMRQCDTPQLAQPATACVN